MDKIKRVIVTCLFAISVVCLIFAAIFLVWDRRDSEAVLAETTTDMNFVDESGQRDLSEETQEFVSADVSVTSVNEAVDSETENNEAYNSISSEITTENADEDTEVSTDIKKELKEEVIKVDNPYKEEFLANSDMVARIVIPDTEIDYPVMWTPEDENFYLYRGFDKNYSRVGLPFLDTDSTMYPASTNLIVHGHNIKNQMFFFILQYKSEEYCKEHPYIYLYGKDKEHIYEVMAVFRSKVFYKTDTCFKYYKFFNAETEEEFKDFYDNVKDLALYDTGVTAEFNDKFLTLSTCSSHTENGRFVVVAKEIDGGAVYEDIE